MAIKKGAKPKASYGHTKAYLKAESIQDRVFKVLGEVYTIDPDTINGDYVLDEVAQDDEELILRLWAEFKLQPPTAALAMFTTAADVIKFYSDNKELIDKPVPIDPKLADYYETLIAGVVFNVVNLKSVDNKTSILGTDIGKAEAETLRKKLGDVFELEIPRLEWIQLQTVGDILSWYGQRWMDMDIDISMENDLLDIAEDSDPLTPAEAVTLVGLLATYMPNVHTTILEEDPEAIDEDRQTLRIIPSAGGRWTAEYTFNVTDSSSYLRAILHSLRELDSRGKNGKTPKVVVHTDWTDDDED